MPNVADALRGVSAYPIPARTLGEVAARRGVDLFEEVSPSVVMSAPFRLCHADLLMWLSLAPDISQGGQTYSFTDAQREDMRRRARQEYAELDAASVPKTTFGYKGTTL